MSSSITLIALLSVALVACDVDPRVHDPSVGAGTGSQAGVLTTVPGAIPHEAPEGFARWEPTAPVSLLVSGAQPVRIEPPEACVNERVRLFPAPGRAFPTGPGVRVLFAPCGVPGTIFKSGPDHIEVRVPDGAESGPVWVVDGAADADVALEGGRRCLQRRLAHDVVPERPVTTCAPAVGLADPRLGLRLGAVPAPVGFADDEPVGLPSAPDVEPRIPAPPPGEPARCEVLQDRPRGAVTFGGGDDDRSSGTSTRRQVGTPGRSSGCFTTCQEVIVEDTSVAGTRQASPLNLLAVRTLPRITRFWPERSAPLATREHRVAPGLNAIAWEIVSGEAPAATCTCQTARCSRSSRSTRRSSASSSGSCATVRRLSPTSKASGAIVSPARRASTRS